MRSSVAAGYHRGSVGQKLAWVLYGEAALASSPMAMIVPMYCDGDGQIKNRLEERLITHEEGDPEKHRANGFGDRANGVCRLAGEHAHALAPSVQCPGDRKDLCNTSDAVRVATRVAPVSSSDPLWWMAAKPVPVDESVVASQVGEADRKSVV